MTKLVLLSVKILRILQHIEKFVDKDHWIRSKVLSLMPNYSKHQLQYIGIYIQEENKYMTLSSLSMMLTLTFFFLLSQTLRNFSRLNDYIILHEVSI